MSDGYIKDADEYYDLQRFGLIDKKGKVIPHSEQHEFMMGYYDDCDIPLGRNRGDNLESIICATTAASIAASAAINC
jgi:hypothetical protein